MILPNDINLNEFAITIVKQRNQQKLLKLGHLGIILNRMTMNDNEDKWKPVH